MLALLAAMLLHQANINEPHKEVDLFAECKFDKPDDVPPEKLRLTYATFAASVKTGGQAKYCLPHSVEVSNAEDPKRGDTALGINVPWMKKNFDAEVLRCQKEPDNCFLLRTGSSYTRWVETRSGEWRIYQYGDKPIR
jgi:hypothetical protein